MELDFGHTEHGTQKTEDGWTDGRGSRNSYLDDCKLNYETLIKSKLPKIIILEITLNPGETNTQCVIVNFLLVQKLAAQGCLMRFRHLD